MGSKKEKKDKKDKKSKKSKKDKKSSKSSKRTSSRQENHATLSNLLSYSLLEKPQLMTDLPMISKSLDDGEYVDISNISDEGMRKTLQNMMKFLPVLYNESNGWYKETQSTNITNYILKQLQTEGSIKLQNDLSMSETVASKNVTLKLMILLQKIPELKLELESLFDTLLNGNSIQVDDLENEDIRDGLEDIFHAIGLVRTKDGFTIPEGKKEELISEIIELIKNVFSKYQVSMEYLKEKNVKTLIENNSTGNVNTVDGSVESDSSKDSGSNSDSSSDSEDDYGLQRENHGVKNCTATSTANTITVAEHSPPSTAPPAVPVVVKGPSMPTIQDLLHARTFIEQQQQHNPNSTSRQDDGSSSEDDDAYGPQVCDPRTARILQAHASVQPLGFAGGEIEPAFERAFAYDILGKYSSM